MGNGKASTVSAARDDLKSYFRSVRAVTGHLQAASDIMPEELRKTTAGSTFSPERSYFWFISALSEAEGLVEARLGSILGFLSCNWPYLWAKRCSRCLHRRGTEQVAQADQVVGDHVQVKHTAHLFDASQFELAQTTPLILLRRRLRLDSGKHLLDAPAGLDRLGVALVAGGAAINRRAAWTAGVLGYVGRDANATHLSHRLGDLAIHDQGMRLSMSTWPR